MLQELNKWWVIHSVVCFIATTCFAAGEEGFIETHKNGKISLSTCTVSPMFTLAGSLCLNSCAP